jgi:hypothetical protein
MFIALIAQPAKATQINKRERTVMYSDLISDSLRRQMHQIYISLMFVLRMPRVRVVRTRVVMSVA